MLMKLTPAQQLIPQSQFNNLRCRTTITMPFTKIWLNLLMVVWSWIKPIFANAFLAAKKNENCFKSGLKRLKNNHSQAVEMKSIQNVLPDPLSSSGLSEAPHRTCRKGQVASAAVTAVAAEEQLPCCRLPVQLYHEISKISCVFCNSSVTFLSDLFI